MVLTIIINIIAIVGFFLLPNDDKHEAAKKLRKERFINKENEAPSGSSPNSTTYSLGWVLIIIAFVLGFLKFIIFKEYE